MQEVKAVVVASDMVTPYGWGVDACWRGLFSKKTAISRLNRFCTKAFQSNDAATIDGLEYHQGDSLVMQMLRPFLRENRSIIPEDAHLFLATAKGEIDFLEKQMIEGKDDFSECKLDVLLRKVSVLTGIQNTGTVVSVACISSTAALAQAASGIRSKSCDCAVVVACDSVTEFIFSGFSTLMALDKYPAKPFDRKRNGLSLGEAAAFALVMSESRAKREGREIIGEIAGWGLSSDANHMTGPLRDGSGLVKAIKKALQTAGIGEEAIGSIAAHGTGTVYNDAMEMKSFRSVFGDLNRSVYSIKGGIGHTTGAAGLVEAIIALRSLNDGVSPPTVNLEEVDEDAVEWASPYERSLEKGKMALSTNSGFGGVNAALVLASPE